MYFDDCKDLAEGRKMYHELLLEHHPDHGGNEETCKKIINEFEEFLNDFMNASYQSWSKESGKDFDFNSYAFAEVLKDIMNFNMTIDIIGFWIYAFNSYAYKEQLKELGFWYSKKHKAWIFSGRPKVNIRSRYSTNAVREMHGFEHLRDKENVSQIA